VRLGRLRESGERVTGREVGARFDTRTAERLRETLMLGAGGKQKKRRRLVVSSSCRPLQTKKSCLQLTFLATSSKKGKFRMSVSHRTSDQRGGVAVPGHWDRSRGERQWKGRGLGEIGGVPLVGV